MANRYFTSTMKSWLDRVVQFVGRRTITIESQSASQIIGTVTRNEGTVTTEGDVLDATNLNDLENRIDTAFTAVQTDIDTYKSYIDQGVVNSLDFSGLASGRYICSFEENSTGAPNTSEGVCVTVINQNTAYGAQTVVSYTGNFYRKYSAGAWGAWQQYESTTNRVASISSSSDNNHYPTAKAVYDSLFQFNNAGRNTDWKNATNGAGEWFFYEGASTSTYDIPTGNCAVLILKYSAARGIAFAFGWAGGSTDKTVWKNTLHDSWKGWVSLHSN